MSRSILIVEDAPELRRELCHRFRSAGWVAYAAATLDEAELLLPLAPDVILADRRLDPGDGASLVGRGIPVVITSGDDRPVAGALALLRKPVRLAEIVGLVAAALGRTSP